MFGLELTHESSGEFSEHMNEEIDNTIVSWYAE
jgi:hypothetical protein